MKRSIDIANKQAKKVEPIGYHSNKKYFKLNPSRKKEENIYSKDYDITAKKKTNRKIES